MTREELKGKVFKTHSPLTVEEVMFSIDRYVEQIRAEERNKVIEECIDILDRLKLNTLCNSKIKTTEQIDAYMKCISDAKKAISEKV